MARVLRVPSLELEIGRSDEFSENCLPIPDDATALHLLRRFLLDPFNQSALRNLLLECAPSATLAGLTQIEDEEALLRTIASQLVTRRLRIRPYGREGPRPMPAPAPEAPRPAPPAAQKKEDRLVLCRRLFYHDETTPYALKKYELIFPSGKKLEGRTDEQGYLRHEVDEDGAYQIRLLHGAEPELFEPRGEEDEDPEQLPNAVLCAVLLNETGWEPVADAQVDIPELGESAFTDESGYFETLHVEPGEYEILVRGKRIVVPTHDEPSPEYRIRLPKARK